LCALSICSKRKNPLLLPPQSIGLLRMSLAEIKTAVGELSAKELAELAAYIRDQDKQAWDREIEEDFSPGGKHEAVLAEVDAQIDAGNFKPLA
jgi:hypothetical protein